MFHGYVYDTGGYQGMLQDIIEGKVTKQTLGPCYRKLAARASFALLADVQVMYPPI